MVKGAELDIVVCVFVANKETWCKFLDFSRHAKQVLWWCAVCVLCGATIVSLCVV